MNKSYNRKKNNARSVNAKAVVTQGCYSFLEPMTLEDCDAQLSYCICKGYAIGLEYTYDPHPRNAYWDMWGKPLFQEERAVTSNDIIYEMKELLRTHPKAYQKIVAFDNNRGTESCSMAFIIHRPKEEKGFRLHRQEGHSRLLRYTIEAKELSPAAVSEEDYENTIYR